MTQQVKGAALRWLGWWMFPGRSGMQTGPWRTCMNWINIDRVTVWVITCESRNKHHGFKGLERNLSAGSRDILIGLLSGQVSGSLCFPGLICRWRSCARRAVLASLPTPAHSRAGSSSTLEFQRKDLLRLSDLLVSTEGTLFRACPCRRGLRYFSSVND